MKIVITGASGFVGTNLRDYLKTENEMAAISVRYIPNQQFDLKGDALIHLAGKAHDLKKVSNPIEYKEANYELTKQLFDSFLVSQAKVFIFMSSVKAVADSLEGILTEDFIPNPQTHYGIAKRQAEEYILSRELPRGKQVFILRPCMVHGPGNKGNLNLLYQLVAKKLPWPLGAFINQRSFLSIDNLCFVIKKLIENKSIPSGVYNVADDDALSTNDLIQLLGECLGKPTKIWNWSENVMRFLAKVGDILPSPLNSERLQKLTESYVVSNHKIVKAIGEFLPISAEDGLIKTIKSFRK